MFLKVSFLDQWEVIGPNSSDKMQNKYFVQTSVHFADYAFAALRLIYATPDESTIKKYRKASVPPSFYLK